MKQEFLFRGKRIDNKEWIVGSLVMVCNGETLKRYPNIVISYNHDTFDWHEVIPETVGILIFVINGHKYFEGDIIGNDKNNIKYVILWNKENQCFSTFSNFDLDIINGKDELFKINVLSNKEQVRVTFIKKYNFYPFGNIFDDIAKLN